MEKTPKIFISHSSKDKEYVELIVNLLEGMGLNQTQVFCSSLPGYGIPIGEDIYNYLRAQFEEHVLHVIYILSENYYNSTVCLNEMGAAWAFRNEATSVLLPHFGFEQVKGVVNSNAISIKLDMPRMELQDKLNQLQDIVIKEFNIIKKADIIWEQKRDKFIEEIGRIALTRKNTIVMSEDTSEKNFSNKEIRVTHNDGSNKTREELLRLLNITYKFTVEYRKAFLDGDRSKILDVQQQLQNSLLDIHYFEERYVITNKSLSDTASIIVSNYNTYVEAFNEYRNCEENEKEIELKKKITEESFKAFVERLVTSISFLED